MKNINNESLKLLTRWAAALFGIAVIIIGEFFEKMTISITETRSISTNLIQIGGLIILLLPLVRHYISNRYTKNKKEDK